jgi:enoyl-CoA hydratase/carnithine racemase
VPVSAFEQLFVDAERLVEKVDEWVETVAAAPPMSVGQQEVLIERSRESSRVRRRLRSMCTAVISPAST